MDKISYALGMNVAHSLIDSGVETKTFRINDFKDGFTDLFNLVTKGGPYPKLTGQEVESILSEYFNKIRSEAEENMKSEGRKFLEENAKKDGVVVLPSGLQYEVIRDSEGLHPSSHSTVKVHYEGRLINGDVFDSSYQRGEPISFNLQSVIKGWTEGVQLMTPGSKYTFYIPYELAYGEMGTGPIPPYATLIFDVELLEIIP